MEEGLRLIGMYKECPTDKGFTFQVRLQLLAQRAAHIREQREADRANATAASTTSLPAILYLKALQGQVQEMRDSLTPEIQPRGA